MKKEEIKNILGGNELRFANVSFFEVNELMRYAKVNLKIDSVSLDYYYEIDIEELCKSSIPLDMVNGMKDRGWCISKDGKKIILFLNI